VYIDVVLDENGKIIDFYVGLGTGKQGVFQP